MSMHLRGSRDMMGHHEEEGWWKSRTGLEQKLVILSTLLFILSFGLTISVVVLKNNNTCTAKCTTDLTTSEPSNSTVTEEVSTVSTSVTASVSPDTSSSEAVTSSEAATSSVAATSSEAATSSVVATSSEAATSSVAATSS